MGDALLIIFIGLAAILLMALRRVLTDIFSELIRGEIDDRTPGAARRMVSFAARCLPPEHADDRRDEWLTEIDAILEEGSSVEALRVALHAIASVPGLRLALRPAPARARTDGSTAQSGPASPRGATIRGWVARLSGAIGLIVKVFPSSVQVFLRAFADGGRQMMQSLSALPDAFRQLTVPLREVLMVIRDAVSVLRNSFPAVRSLVFPVLADVAVIAIVLTLVSIISSATPLAVVSLAAAAFAAMVAYWVGQNR